MGKLLDILAVFINSGLKGVLISNTKIICKNMYEAYCEYKKTNNASEQQLIEFAIDKEPHFKKINNNSYRYENSTGIYTFESEKFLDLKDVIKGMVTVMVNARTKNVGTEWYSKILKNCLDEIDTYFKSKI